MRVLNVNMSIDPVTGGGTAERTVKISKYLARSGVESALLTSNIGVDKKLRNSLSGVRLHILKSLYNRYFIPRISYKRLSRLVAEADVVHLMNHWTAINAAVYWTCQKLNKPYVVCPAGALSYYGRSQLLKRLYNTVVGRCIIRNAARHVAIPAEEAHQFGSYGIDPGTVQVIPNGIDRNDFQIRNDESFRSQYALEDKPYILFLGRLNSIKGPDLLLDAFIGLQADLPDWLLVFAGPDGGMRKSLEAAVHRNRLSNRVRFIGYLGGPEKSMAYHAADLLVIPSRQEAMSIVALEAGIVGTPVLLTDVCGFEQIETIGGGAMVAPDASAIRHGLRALLKDRDDLERMGRALHGYVSENYTWESVIKKYISLFRDVLS